MSTVSAKTHHTVEYTVNGCRQLAQPNSEITLESDEADELAALGALSIIKDDVAPVSILESKNNWKKNRIGR